MGKHKPVKEMKAWIVVFASGEPDRMRDGTPYLYSTKREAAMGLTQGERVARVRIVEEE